MCLYYKRIYLYIYCACVSVVFGRYISIIFHWATCESWHGWNYAKFHCLYTRYWIYLHFLLTYKQRLVALHPKRQVSVSLYIIPTRVSLLPAGLTGTTCWTWDSLGFIRKEIVLSHYGTLRMTFTGMPNNAFISLISGLDDTLLLLYSTSVIWCIQKHSTRTDIIMTRAGIYQCPDVLMCMYSNVIATTLIIHV